MPARSPAPAGRIVSVVIAAAAAVVMSAPAAHAAAHHRSLAVDEHDVARNALKHVGQRYRSGATGPRAFDCSGLALYLYRQVHIHLPRTAEQQYRATRRVARTHARPGDLVFYHSGGSVYHVAIFEGHNMQVAAATPRDGVVHQHIWSAAVTFGRPRS
jgi:cell wall-associated NlpC family hydrolase